MGSRDRSSLLTIISETEASELGFDDFCQDDDSQNDLKHNPGDIIVTCRPFVHIITDSMKGKLCDLCLKPGNLRQCGDCDQIYFCKSCLSSAAPSIFKTLHLLECPYLEKYGAILSSSSKCVLRLYLRITNPESLPYLPYSNPLTNESISFDNLVGRIIFNSDSKNNEINDLCEQIKNVCDKYQLNNVKIIPEKDSVRCERQKLIDDIQLNPDLSVEELSILQFINLLDEFRLCDDLIPFITGDLKIYELWTIFVKLWSYAVPIFDETISGLFSINPIAYGLYLEPSVVIDSHSCLPNCCFAYYGPVIQLRAIKRIYAEQKLTVNYVDITSAKIERIAELRSYFICSCFCNRCSNPHSNPIDYAKFKLLKEEFVSLYSTELAPVTAERSFLNFSTTSTNDEDIMAIYRDCTHISQLASELYTYYQLIYPDNHPDKSRFLFAYTAVEMNLLLFKLEIRNGNLEETNIHTGNSSDSLGNDSNLDLLIVDINKWSNLLKLTVKSIRWTHGVDHRLFRQMAIPLSRVWQKGAVKKLTLSELHSDPSVLLKILCSSSTTRQNSFFQNQFEHLVTHFKQLIPTISRKPDPERTNSDNSSLADKTPPKSRPRATYEMLVTLLRTVLIVFSLLFPFFVYFVVYVEDF